MNIVLIVTNKEGIVNVKTLEGVSEAGTDKMFNALAECEADESEHRAKSILMESEEEEE